MKLTKGLAFFGVLLCMITTGAFAGDHSDQARFVPDSQRFWDFSKNWTTNYGPAYRDTILEATNLVPCTGVYADCFSSGPEPLPCELDKSGRFADCKCNIQTGLSFVLITSILNYDVYLKTIAVCGTDGSKCATQVDKAPVCRYLREGRLIPGAELISTFRPENSDSLKKTVTGPKADDDITLCSKGPYAGCMTAPCQIKGGYAQCNCPVFYGEYQLTTADAKCNLSDDLVWSASYTPALFSKKN